MTPDELTAIRVECAEAMGFIPQYKNLPNSNDQVWKKPGVTGENMIHDYDIIATLPNYPTEANAALTLAAALAEDGWTSWINGDDNEWEVMFTNEEESHFATAPTFQLALCVAFLKVHRSKKTNL